MTTVMMINRRLLRRSSPANGVYASLGHLRGWRALLRVRLPIRKALDALGALPRCLTSIPFDLNHRRTPAKVVRLVFSCRRADLSDQPFVLYRIPAAEYTIWRQMIGFVELGGSLYGCL